MTERTDLTTQWGLSPRLVEMDAATPAPRDISLQDLVDTLKSNTQQASENDDSLDNIDDDPLIDSAGKEDLGSGQLVGITATFQNAQFAFNPKTAPAETGTATSADAGGTVLTDTAATFVTNSVARGAIIVNFTDQSIAEVLTVDSETQITHRVLVEGTNNDWSISDAYKIWNIEQVDISGGNLVALDDIGGELSPIFPTAFTQVVRTASASATLQELSSIQYSSFNGGVTLDTVNGVASTTFPAGTGEQPVKTLAQAQTVAVERGFTTIFVRGNYTFLASDVIDNYVVEGQNPSQTSITLTAAATITNCTFVNASISGFLDGGNVVSECRVGSIDYIDGDVQNSELEDGATITLSGAAAEIINCYSGAGSPSPIIDCGGSGTELAIRDYFGGLQITNHSGTDDISVDMGSGELTLASTVSAGVVVVRGIAKLIDNTTGTAIVDSADLLIPSRLTNLQFLVESLRPTHTATGDIWYWDPVNGNDANAGTSPDFAVQSFAAAHALVTDWGHDVIVAVPGNSGAETVYTDPIEITKNWVFLRGPGADFIIRPTTTNADGSLISLPTTTGVSLSGFILDGANAGAATAMKMTAHDIRMADLRIENITGDGISTVDCNNNTTENVIMNAVSGTALLLDNCIQFIGRNIAIAGSATGFLATATTPGQGGESDLDNISFTDCAVAIQINTNVTDVKIRSNCRFVGNTQSHIIDNGIDTNNEFAKLGIIRGGIAQGPGTGPNQIQLDANASSVNGAYDPSNVTIVHGPGAGETRLVLQYDGTTKTATVDRNWKVTPTSASEFKVTPSPGREHVNEGLAQGGALGTITLNANASTDNKAYVGQTVFIRSGAGEDQARRITAYDGATKVATVSRDWDVTPTTTSGYLILPTSLVTPGDVWDEVAADHETAGTMGERMRFAEALLRNRTETNPATGLMTVYDSDNVTPLFTANVYEDVAAATPYAAGSTEINRRNRLE